MSTDIGMGHVKQGGFTTPEHYVPIGSPDHLGAFRSRISGLVMFVTPGNGFRYVISYPNLPFEPTTLPISEAAAMLSAGLWERIEP